MLANEFQHCIIYSYSKVQKVLLREKVKFLFIQFTDIKHKAIKNELKFVFNYTLT